MKQVLPPATMRKRIPAIEKVTAEVEDLRAKAMKARQDLVELEHARALAIKTDAQAAANALRAKKPAPNPTVPKATAAIEKQKPISAALEVAVTDAEADLGKAIEEHGAGLRAKLVDEADTQRLECQKAAQDLAEKIDQRQATLALCGWLESPDRDYMPMRYGVTRVQGLGPKQNGEEFKVAEVAAALVGAFEPPPPPAPKPKAQPLTIVSAGH